MNDKALTLRAVLAPFRAAVKLGIKSIHDAVRDADEAATGFLKERGKKPLSLRKLAKGLGISPALVRGALPRFAKSHKPKAPRSRGGTRKDLPSEPGKPDAKPDAKPTAIPAGLALALAAKRESEIAAVLAKCGPTTLADLAAAVASLGGKVAKTGT